jgi:hypothetical protein
VTMLVSWMDLWVPFLVALCFLGLRVTRVRIYTQY